MNEKIKSPGRWLILTAALLVLILALAAGIGGTRADPESGASLTVVLNDMNTGRSYRFIPGFHQEIDPTVTVQTNASCFVFVKVKSDSELLSWEIANGWTELTSGVNGLSEGERLFYREMNISGTDTATQTGTFTVFKGNSITYSAAVSAPPSPAPALSFTAYAVSKTDYVSDTSTVSGSNLTDAADAWNTFFSTTGATPAP